MAAAEAEKTAKAVVARGRTIITPKGEFGPGAEIDVPVSEIGSLRKRGFLVNPHAKEIPRADGPVFMSEGQNIGRVAA